jgi:hypothetical protein
MEQENNMTQTIDGKHHLYAKDFEPLSVIYKQRSRETSCSHGLLVYANKVGIDNRPQIRETCVECGYYASQQLKLSDHPDHLSYPVINDNFGSFSPGMGRRVMDARAIEYEINEIGDSGGGEIDRGKLWHQGDLSGGRRCIDSWNEILDGVLNTDIPRERVRALQFGLVNMWYHDETLDILVAVSFEPNEYGSILATAIAKRIPLRQLSISNNVDARLTRFGDGFRYEDFLTSVQWSETRHAATWWAPNDRSAYANHPMCEIPNCSGRNRKIECHHLTYDRAGHEEPGDLIFACAECHENLEYIKKITPSVYKFRAVA